MKNVIIFSIVFSLFLCLFTPTPYAQQTIEEHQQQWKKLNAEVEKAFHEGRYSEGIPIGEKAYQYALKQLGKEHPDTLISINNLPDCMILRDGTAKQSRCIKWHCN